MADRYQRLLRHVSELQRQIGQMFRVGQVHEVKGSRMRMIMGKDKDGKDVLSGWLPVGGSMYGGERERRFFKKGQNLMMMMVNGDPTQAIALPFAPNQQNQAPDHAKKGGGEERVWQQGDLRGRETKDNWTVFRQPPRQQQQQQASTTTGTNGSETSQGWGHEEEQDSDADGDKAEQVSRMDKDGGLTGRVGKDVRYAAHKEGAKLRAKNNFSTVTKDKVIVKAKDGVLYLHGESNIYINKPPVIQSAPDDPVPNDDKVN